MKEKSSDAMMSLRSRSTLPSPTSSAATSAKSAVACPSLTSGANSRRKSTRAVAPKRRRHALRGALHVVFDELHRLVAESAHRAADRRRLRDHVIGVAALDEGRAQHRGIERVDIARHDRPAAPSRCGSRPAPDRCSSPDARRASRAPRRRCRRTRPPAIMVPGRIANLPTASPDDCASRTPCRTGSARTARP